jgi:hypothetical protein
MVVTTEINVEEYPDQDVPSDVIKAEKQIL